MVETLPLKMALGLGYASRPDAFQCGREAAQMAQNQLADGNIDLALALGRESHEFSNFVEGVRLVTGESHLIGIPSARVASCELDSATAAFVMLFSSRTHCLSMAHSELTDDRALVCSTELLTQFRSHVTESRRTCPRRGILLFSNSKADIDDVSRQMCADMASEGWFVNVRIKASTDSTMVCGPAFVRSGFVGLEFRSHAPYGLSFVNLEPFADQKSALQEAVKTAIRDAFSQVHSESAVVLVFSNRPNESLAELEPIRELEKGSPIIFVSTENQSALLPSQGLQMTRESVIALMVPR